MKKLIFPYNKCLVKDLYYVYKSSKYKNICLSLTTGLSLNENCYREIEIEWETIKSGVSSSISFHINKYGVIDYDNYIIRCLFRCGILTSMYKVIKAKENKTIEINQIGKNILKLGKTKNFNIDIKIKNVRFYIFINDTFSEILWERDYKINQYCIEIRDNTIKAPKVWIKRNTLNKILKFVLLTILVKK